MATVMATGPMKMAPRTEGIIEATAPEAEGKLSTEIGHVGIVERRYGLEARVTPGITFEEYRHWAKIERQIEREENRQYVSEKGPTTVASVLKGRFSKGVHHDNAKRSRNAGTNETEQSSEKSSQIAVPPPPPDAQVADANAQVTDAEWRTAARALRTASWGTIFYVMTTDILGFQGTPSVFSSVGYGPGTALYVIFALAAAASGWMIWRTFLGLDSSRYPMLSYGDPFFRIYGPNARHFINVTQSIQQFFSVAVLLLGQSQILYQVAENKICFVVCMIIVMVVGMISGSIRSLQRLGWLCNAAVWINVVSFILIIAAAATAAPEYSVVNSLTLIKTQGNIKTFAGPPPAEYQQQSKNEFAAQFNGIDSMVYSYSGAVLFVAFLAEMRQPFDFWKGMIVAQSFICVIYTVFGAVVYSFYGQYSYTSITQVLQPHGVQIAGNVLNLVTGFLAIFLYFNIGMKTIYLEVGQELLKLPPITTKKGRITWYLTGPFYWVLALVVAASVPNFSGIANFVGGLFGVNFTYSLPGIMYVGYKIQCGAKMDGEGFNPETGVTVRHDKGLKRWVRGYKKTFVASSLAILFSLAGLATSGMGTWAAIEGLIATLGPGGQIATSWSCTALS